MITVMGATGNTGHKVARGLLKEGRQFRALGRSEKKLAELKNAGAEVLIGDAADPTFLTQAFIGAQAAYVLIPAAPNTSDFQAEQHRQGEAIAKALRDSGVGYVVALSSLGADLTDETGLILGLHALEERLKELPSSNVLLLRPASFFENFYQTLSSIKEQGIIVDSIRADLAVPMVATRDIAHAASEALTRRDWQGVAVRELLGPRDLSHAEATRIIAERIGMPELKYVEVSKEEIVGAFVQAGMSQTFAELYVEMTRAINSEKLRTLRGRTPENTTQTSFEAFGDEFALVYREV